MFRESGDDTEVMAKLRKKFRMCPTVMSGKKEGLHRTIQCSIGNAEKIPRADEKSIVFEGP